jgi:hypothetical protein
VIPPVIVLQIDKFEKNGDLKRGLGILDIHKQIDFQQVTTDETKDIHNRLYESEDTLESSHNHSMQRRIDRKM